MLIARAQAAVFFALLLLYAWLRLDPSLAYHCQQPLFFTGTAHLWAHLGFPGGPLEYVGAWLSQLLFYPWAGAALTAVSARLVGRAVGAWVTTAGRPRSPLWEMGPAALVLAQHSHCTHPIHLDLATAAGVAVAAAYGRHAPRAAAPRLAVFAALAALLWYAAYPAVALFAALAGLLEIRQTRRWPAALVCFAAIPLAALAYGYWRWLALGPALLALCPPLETWLADGGLDRAVPGILLYLLVAGSAIWPVRRPGAARPAHESGPKTALRVLGLPLLALLPALILSDGDARARVELDREARRENWGRVLEVGAGLDRCDPLQVYDIQQALYHRGALVDSLFAYPHVPRTAILTFDVNRPASLEALSHVLFQLGSVNKAEHLAHEALEIFGDRPSLLKRLVLINTLKGRRRAAGTFLGRLEMGLLHDAWARRHRQALERGSPWAGDAALTRVRARMPRADDPGYPSTEARLQILLAANRRNHMAFEYLMAHYLLAGRSDLVVANVARLGDFPERYGAAAIPRHCEEAFLLHVAGAGDAERSRATAILGGRQINPATVRRFEEFKRVLRAHGDDREAARGELGPSHGDTYWYYFAFSDPLSAPMGPEPPGAVNPQQ